MKAVILAGGKGTRISEESHLRPKPMIEIGGRPLLWHIMSLYGAHGVNDFVVALGYRGDMIKQHFANYALYASDITVDTRRGEIMYHRNYAEPWRVTLVDTGEETMTGGRIKRLARFLDPAESFCMTYGDGVSDIDIGALIAFHRAHGKLATVTAVIPPGRYGALALDGDRVLNFTEKPPGDNVFVSGGFFVLKPDVLDRIDGDTTSWETAPLESLARDRELLAFRHTGFWHAMDTLRDRTHLEALWQTGRAPLEGLDRVTRHAGTDISLDRPRGTARGHQRRKPREDGAAKAVSVAPVPRRRPHALAPASCRLCGAGLTRSLLDLGATPLANNFITPTQALLGVDRSWKLHVRICDGCLLAQLDTVVPADSIFTDYAYFSSYSSSWVAHARRYAEMAIRRFALDEGSLVIEVASNDGYMLQHFITAGIPVLGIEPAANVAAIARERGVPTEIAFFGAATAGGLVERGLRADLVIANNVMPHVPDVTGFSAGVARVLTQGGVATFEFQHLLRLIEGVQFDTIYHEHYSYLTLLVVERLLRGAGLRVFDVEELPTHGGSLRVYACHEGAMFGEQLGLARVRAAERRAGLDTPDGYAGFAPRVARVQRDFRAFLRNERLAGRSVAGYGAAAKGSTLLNTCGVTEADMPFVVDRNPAKQGRLMPGCHIPILPADTLFGERPDNVVILPWNLGAEIAAELAPLRATGTRLWVAIPELREV